jgi:cobalt/nickel transport system permease protein
MYPQLHIPDGFLSPQVSLVLWVATAVLIGIAVRKTSRTDVRLIASQPILMGVLGAFIFAAQMFNFPVATGTSGHLLGGVLAGYLLGPWAGTIVMATVIGIQALLSQDGGLLVLGANIFNMGVIGTLGGSFVARGIGTTLGGSRSATILGAGVAAWLAVVAAAGMAGRPNAAKPSSAAAVVAAVDGFVGDDVCRPIHADVVPGGDAAKAFGAITAQVAEKLKAFNATAGGSSRKVGRFRMLTSPPSLDAGEITDKGYVNQRATQDARAAEVASLFGAEAGPGVVQV